MTRLDAAASSRARPGGGPFRSCCWRMRSKVGGGGVGGWVVALAWLRMSRKQAACPWWSTADWRNMLRIRCARQAGTAHCCLLCAPGMRRLAAGAAGVQPAHACLHGQLAFLSSYARITAPIACVPHAAAAGGTACLLRILAAGGDQADRLALAWWPRKATSCASPLKHATVAAGAASRRLDVPPCAGAATPLAPAHALTVARGLHAGQRHRWAQP